MVRTRRLAICLAILGCGFEPEGAVPFDPPPLYREWWSATESCSGRRGAFDEVTWAYVPGRAFACPSGACVGRWEPGSRVYVAQAYQDHELVVRHEMLHALIGRAGHPDPPFGQGCPLTWETWYHAGREVPPVTID
ncbi:MAG: hypothetical protein ACKVZ0_11830 [Gemmatimonadales bacterium]